MLVKLGLDVGGERDVGRVGRMDGPTLVDDVFGGVDPIGYFVRGLKYLSVNVFVVGDVGVDFGVGIVDEGVGDALAGEGKNGERVVEEGGGGVEGGFTDWVGGMVRFVVGVVVVEFVFRGVRVEEEG